MKENKKNPNVTNINDLEPPPLWEEYRKNMPMNPDMLKVPIPEWGEEMAKHMYDYEKWKKANER